jgi:WD40 repeat protein
MGPRQHGVTNSQERSHASGVFVSHSSSDNVLAYDLADRLAANGFEPFVDFEGIPGGAQWERVIYDAMQRSVALVLCATPESLNSRWVFAEMILARFSGVAVIPLVLRECELPSLLADTQHINVTRDPATAYRKLIESLNRLAPARARITWPADTCPYPGLAAFDEDRASMFFGRERDIDTSLQRLRSLGKRRNVLVIVGPSGSGKSSLLRAGIVPRLKLGALDDSATWQFAPPFVPGETPFRNLALALRILGGAHARVEQIEANLRLDEGILHECLNIIQRPGARIVISIDQLEEIHRRTAPSEAAAFLQRLQSAVEAPDSPIVLLATLRSDFLSACLSISELGRLLPTSVSLLAPLEAPFLRLAMEEPARRAGFTLEAGVVDSLLQDARDAEALPLLAFHLAKLWHDMREHDQKKITISALGRIGNMADTVRRAADDVFETVPTASRETVLDQLTRLADVDERGELTRRRERLSSFSEDVRGFLQLFADARLLSTSADGSEISVVHEAVLRAWPPLRSRLEAKTDILRVRRDLERDTAEWARLGQSAALLWRRERLATGFALLDYDSVPADDRRRLFLETSRREERSIRERESMLLARRAMRDLATDPERAMLLVLASIEEYAWTADAERALREAFDRSPCRGLLQSDHELTGLQLSPDGSTLLTGGTDGTARVWDLATGQVRCELAGHGGAIRSVAFNQSGTTVVTASDDETARLWDAMSGKELRVLRRHVGPVRTARFNADGSAVITSGADGTARLWDATSGLEYRVFPGQHGALLGAVVSPDGTTVLTVSASLPSLWDVTTGRERWVLVGHDDAVRGAVFSPDGTAVLTASDDKTARIWDVSTGFRRYVLGGHDSPVRAALFSSDGQMVLTASDDGSARLWDAGTGQLRQFLRRQDGPMTTAAFSPDDETVFTASSNGVAVAWSTASGRERYVFRGHTGPIRAVAISSDGANAFSGGVDGSVRLWPLTRGAERFTLRGHSQHVRIASFSPDCATVLSASHDGTARMWDVATGRERHKLVHEDWVSDARFSPDGRTLVTTSHDGAARLWDAVTGVGQHLLLGHSSAVATATFSPNGKSLVTAGHDGVALLWDTSSGRLRHAYEADAQITLALFSPDGTALVTTSDDGMVRVWDVDQGAQRHVLECGSAITSAIFSPGGDPLITSSENGVLLVWDLAAGRVLHTVSAHKACVSSVACDPLGTTLVTSSHDFTARLWDVATWRERHVLRGHEDSLWSASFSPDGRTLVTASADRTARIWDVATGRERHTLRGHEGALTCASFSPDGTTVMTAGTDRTIRLWSWWERDQLLELARNRVFRVLTDREREDFGLPVTRIGNQRGL